MKPNHKENIEILERVGKDMLTIYRQVGPKRFRPIFFSVILGVAEVIYLDGELEGMVKDPVNDNNGELVKDKLGEWMKELPNIIKAKQEFTKSNRN